MPTIEEVTKTLESFDTGKYNAAVSYIFYLAHMPDPFEPMSRDELMDKLAKSRKDAEAGRVRDARLISKEMREKYGLVEKEIKNP